MLSEPVEMASAQPVTAIDAIPGDEQKIPKASAHEKLPSPGLIVIALSEFKRWHTPDGEPWVTHAGLHFPVRPPKQFHDCLAEAYFRKTGRVATTSELQMVERIVASKALHDGPVHPVYVRIANCGEAVLLDLANDDGEAVKITADGWVVIKRDNVPVRFYRPRNMLPLPRPARTADHSAFRTLLNAPTEDSYKLALTWATWAVMFGRPYPILVVSGPQGSAKTTFTRLLRALIDPSAVPVVGLPAAKDLVAYAKNNHLLCFDNLSDIKPALADDLCRLASGGGFGGRQLYTDNDVSAFNAIRPIILNSISSLAIRPDLADRTLLMPLLPIKPDARRTEAEIWVTFARIHPMLLATILEAVRTGLQRLSAIQSQRLPLPRMADFAQWGMAVAPAFGWTAEDFSRAYDANRTTANEAVVEGDAVASAIVELVAAQSKGSWSGTATQLLEKITPGEVGRMRMSGFPTNAPELGDRLRRLKPVLEEEGIVVENTRTAKARTITLRRASCSE